MKKSRSIRNLLIILRDNEKLFVEQKASGLCWFIYRLRYKDIITGDETKNIEAFIHEKCKRNKKYYHQDNILNQPFYFPISEWPPRKAWLNRWIKRLKK